jgi:hypothetical protein
VHLIASGDIHPLKLSEVREEVLFARGFISVALVLRDEFREHRFRLAYDEKIDKICERLWVEEGTDATCDDKRVIAGALGAEQGDPGEGEDSEDSQVIIFKGEGKGDNIKVAEGTARFKAE